MLVRKILLAAVLSMLLVACSGDDKPSGSAREAPTRSPTETAPAAASASPSSPATAAATSPPSTARAATFEQAACPFKPARGNEEGKNLVCGYVTVPEEHANPGGRTIRIAVAVFKGQRATAGDAPFVYLSGGPGAAALEGLAAQLSPPVAAAFAGGGDMVIFDQRGTGAAQPSLACQELTELSYANFNRKLSHAEAADLSLKATAACHDRLVAQGVNLAAYTSAESAADVNDLRTALGYDKLDLYGGSYGTRLALTVMRDFPGILRGVVLDSPVPLQASLYPDSYLSMQRVFDLLFKSCAADQACNTAYPALESVFYRLVARLNDAPLTMKMTHPKTKATYDYLLTGDRLVAAIFQLMYDSPAIADLPRAIDALRDGNTEPLQSHYGDVLFMFEEVSWGMYYSVQCGEEVRFTTAAELQEAARRVRPEIVSEQKDDLGDETLFRTCGLWGARPAAAVENEPVRSDVPTLVLTGQYDPITPPAYGEAVAKYLTHGYVFEYPGLGHGPGLSDLCPFSMMLAFFKDPAPPPDAGCIAKMKGPQWAPRSR